MLLTIALILAAMVSLAALELWLFWRLGERDERRRTRIRAEQPMRRSAAWMRDRGRRGITRLGARRGCADG
jgi:hypothetical protein